MEEAASFLNEVGTLVYFQEEHAIPYVFLDPQWLADVMASVRSCLSSLLLRAYA